MKSPQNPGQELTDALKAGVPRVCHGMRSCLGLLLGAFTFLGLWTGEVGASEKPPCCREAVPASPPTDKSLYNLDSTWNSDQDKKILLGILRGRPQVLALFFTHCEFACPIIVHDLKRIEESLPEPVRGRVDFLLVSLDSERDTPTVLRAYRDRQQLPLANWTLLHGAEDDVRELAALLGVNYRKDARGQFAHSNVITVLNAEGEIIHQQIGLNQSPEATVKALEKSLGAAPPATSAP